MKTNNTRTLVHKASRFVGLFLVFGVLLGLASQEAFAQVPPANTQIGNQASATYIDNGGNPQSITSNTVITVVQQVAGVTVTPGISITVSPGGQVTFPHTITNTGNGVDSFDLTSLDGAGDFNFDNIVIYADNDGNGIPDSFTPITTTPNIDPPGTPNGNTYGILIVADVPVTAGDGDTETIQISVESNHDSNVTDSATNTTTVDEDAVINVQKNRDKQFVAIGDTVTYTFNYAESGGGSNGSNLVISDPLPAGVTYVLGSGRWSGATGTNLTDAAGSETATGISYRFVDSGTDSVVVLINNINAGSSGSVSFKVTVDAGQEGNSIFNSGSFSHQDSPTPSSTNTVAITVDEDYEIVALGADTVSAPVANQGSIINFLNVFKNIGTATDTYNITLSSENYPPGTSFTFYKVDGNGQPTSPFTDTNNDGPVDTGPVAVGDTVYVILQVNLPSGQSGGPYAANKRLTSVNDPNAYDEHVDALAGISVPTVDITNDQSLATDANAPGNGQGPEPTAVTNTAANPGTTVNFTLFINNTSLQADNYSLSYATDTTGAGGLGTGTLPSGWTASFRDPNNGNSVISNSGSIAAGASKQVIFRVNIPAGYAPGTVDVFVRALSQNSGAVDIKHEAVTVNTVRQLTLVSPQNSQVSPGGTVDYIHTLTVNSNVTENDGTNSDLKLDLTKSVPLGWTAVVYWDVDNSGGVNSGDSLVTSAATSGVVDFPATIGSLTFGEQVQFIVQVTASTGLDDGATVTTSIIVSDGLTNVATVSNNDLTEVQAGLLVLDKYHAPNAGPGAAPGTFVQSNFNVLPGDTVWYEVVVVNDGSQPVDTVIVQDVVPSYTKVLVPATISSQSPSISGLTVENTPLAGQTGTIKVSATQLLPTQTFTIRFAVKVDE